MMRKKDSNDGHRRQSFNIEQLSRAILAGWNTFGAFNYINSRNGFRTDISAFNPTQQRIKKLIEYNGK